ncbi:MAG TPA: HAMP domain-containing sensor histidine kinase [Baekduia sp.]|nr:HAMP domain-containing sensor histidine kinase [Baekduia sp.]
MRSLRGRLTVGLTALLAGVLVGTGVLVARDQDRAELEVLDDRLRRTAELSTPTALTAIQEGLPQGDRRLDAVLDATDSALRLVVGSGQVFAIGEPPPAHRTAPPGMRTVTLGGRRYRVLTSTLDEPSLGGLARLETSTSLRAYERRRSRLRRRLVVFGALALAVGAAGVWLASGLVLRPLARLRATTASIAGDEDLGRRVPDDDGPSELRALARSFNAMLARLGRSSSDRERALEATRRFAADAGHELRTPLTSMQATLSSVVRHPELPDERRTRMLAGALEQQARMVALLDGLQALARGDAAPAASDVDLAELVDGALAAAAERHPDVRWRPELPEGAVVLRGWAPGLRSLVDNLVENAARHGGGTVRVALAEGALVVEDDGPGIAEADRERVFGPFTRLDPDRPGSGLGLALVAQQADHHGATVELDASPQLGGARFTVRWRT